MTDRAVETTPRFKARIAGLLYLIIIVGGILTLNPYNICGRRSSTGMDG